MIVVLYGLRYFLMVWFNLIIKALSDLEIAV